MSFTKVEIESSSRRGLGKMSIKAFFDPNKENMGLEQYGLTLYDGVYHEEQLACLENNGIKRYITGLNEFAPDVKGIKDKDQRNAKIKQIREVVAQLEKELASNVIDVKDKEFWNKVKLLRPDNSEFWDSIHLRAGNDSVFLNPHENPYDLIKLCAIEAGGFSIVAKSYEAGQKMSVPPKFYLDKHQETITHLNEARKKRNKALSTLQNLYDSNPKKLLYVTKVIEPGSPQYKVQTPIDILYEAMDEYINGESFERSEVKAADNFIKTADSSLEDLKYRCIVKDATYYNVILIKTDGHIYYKNIKIGRNPSDVVEFLKNPLNEDVYIEILDLMEHEWNN